jgi:hypothetical protein
MNKEKAALLRDALEEKRLLLEVMTKGDPTLMVEARKYIRV